MQEAHHFDERTQAEPSPDPTGSARRRRNLGLFTAGGVLVALLLLAVVPPLINVNRYRKRIARNIGSALGRPVRLDSVTLNVLPWPGFTLENFVVEEDPAFGYEPILRANEVTVHIRLRSLWLGRVEFSRISLADPSVNLVHLADGRWNLQSILTQASHIESAPTAQAYATRTPRFPYIEATGARLNLKLGAVKTPYSLTEADFALWLPESQVWRIRLKATPARTDTIAPGGSSANGSIRIEGTLTRAVALANVPIDLHGEWRDAQLGGLSRLLLGRDAGLRGDLNLTADLVGTMGSNTLHSSLTLANGRRADFVPPHLLAVEAACETSIYNQFHTFKAIQCDWPRSDSSDPRIAILTAEVPDIRHMDEASAQLTVPALPIATLLDWLPVVTSRPPANVLPKGTLAGTLLWRPRSGRPALSSLSGDFDVSGVTLQSTGLGPDPVPFREMLVASDGTAAAPSAAAGPGRAQPARADRIPRSGMAEDLPAPTGVFLLQPVTFPLGGAVPATLEGRFDQAGYTLRLTGPAIRSRLLALGESIPQFGTGLQAYLQATQEASAKPRPTSQSPPDLTLSDDPIALDLTATRTWAGTQTWSATAPAPAARATVKHNRQSPH